MICILSPFHNSNYLSVGSSAAAIALIYHPNIEFRPKATAWTYCIISRKEAGWKIHGGINECVASAKDVNTAPSPSHHNQHIVGRVRIHRERQYHPFPITQQQQSTSCWQSSHWKSVTDFPGGTQKLPIAREMSMGDANWMEITNNNPPNLNRGEVFVGRCILLGTTVFLQPKDIFHWMVN